MIRFQDVEVCYVGRTPILTNINLEIKSHSFHFLTGKSGAGKSSLLKMMYLALAPSKGQDFRLIQNLNICDNVALPLRIFGAKEAIIRRHVPELLDWVGLGNHLTSFPNSLSGGEQQRVAIARAVIARPDLLLADEPTGNVDDKIGERLMYLFEELYKAGTNVVIATHNEALVNNFMYPVLNIEKGNLVLRK
jgi:cell division transport system ATP-binding protein